AETRRMIEELPFTYLHVFTYSARPGTPAALCEGQVPVGLARERNQILREIAAAKKAAFMRGHVGNAISAITLGSRDGAVVEALTNNYQKMKIYHASTARGQGVLVAGGRVLQSNRWVEVLVEGVDGDVLEGRIVLSSLAPHAQGVGQARV